MTEDENKKTPKKRQSPWIRFVCGMVIFVFMVLIICFSMAYLYCKPRYDLAQTFDLSGLQKQEAVSTIVDRNGEKSGELIIQNRRPISINDVSENFINAIIAAEDPNFYSHKGANLKAIARAVYLNFKADAVNKGASTITQQVVRSEYEMRDRTVTRKTTEVFLAVRVEKELGKDRVLELYVNQMYFGSGYYGIAAAAEGFYGKPAEDLTLVESATLAGLIRNPYYRSPRKYPEACKKTRDYVLRSMMEQEYISKKTMDAAVLEPVKVLPKENAAAD